MPFPRPRSIHLDLSQTLYEPLAYYAEQNDMGVQDVLRRMILAWVKEHPVPSGDEVLV